MADTDLRGAMKYVTPDVICAAAKLVRQGKLYPLAHTFEPAMPQLADSPDIVGGKRATYGIKWLERPPAGTRVHADWVAFDTHSGTHIDALAHWSKDGRMYGGVEPDEAYSEDGMQDLGIHQAPPLISRGVLIDAARYKGQDILPGGTLLQPADLQGALAQQGVALQGGDVVLVRTGWARHWTAPRTYMAKAPGLSRGSAEWLADQRCVAIGIDQWVVDAIPPERDEDRRACHEVCLIERGLHIVENMNLEELGHDGVYEFLFVALAVPLKGGTGFPVQAVAMV